MKESKDKPCQKKHKGFTIHDLNVNNFGYCAECQDDRRKIEWKQVKELFPFCPVCGERLQGINSSVSPYSCSCGEWESNWNDPLNYKIKTNG